jgi:hypothetical protein
MHDSRPDMFSALMNPALRWAGRYGIVGAFFGIATVFVIPDPRLSEEIAVVPRSIFGLAVGAICGAAGIVIGDH